MVGRRRLTGYAWCGRNPTLYPTLAPIPWLSAGSQAFQPKLAKLQDFPWNVATAEDQARHRTLYPIPYIQPARACLVAPLTEACGVSYVLCTWERAWSKPC